MKCPNCSAEAPLLAPLRGSWPGKYVCTTCGTSLRARMSMLQSVLMQIVFWVVLLAVFFAMQEFGFVLAGVVAFTLALITTIPFLRVGHLEELA